MATYTPYWFSKAVVNMAKAKIDLSADTLKLSLHTNAFTPLQTTHEFRSDLANEVASGNGYTTGGAALSSLAVSHDAPTKQMRWDIADPSWTFTASKTWRWGVISKIRGGAASADELLCYLDPGADVTASGLYTIQIDTSGLLYGTAS